MKARLFASEVTVSAQLFQGDRQFLTTFSPGLKMYIIYLLYYKEQSFKTVGENVPLSSTVSGNFHRLFINPLTPRSD